ncbi:hypothetical protein GCM10017597_33200 [Brachybacterium conglomeratum]|nr:hypothetical protein GCM10017597_33200 [Brachybacterium conglomeratum]
MFTVTKSGTSTVSAPRISSAVVVTFTRSRPTRPRRRRRGVGAVLEDEPEGEPEDEAGARGAAVDMFRAPSFHG